MAKNVPHFELRNGYGKLPAVGLGTWQALDEELEEALDCALSEGYRHIDTALLYENEHVIGRVLKKWEKKIPRKDLFIATKLPPTGNYPDKVEGFLRTSLKNLQIDYVDLYLIHSPDGIKDLSAISEEERLKGFQMDADIDRVALWKELERQVKLGRARAIGLSNFDVSQVQQILDNSEIKPACLQIEVHAFLQQQDVVQFCKDNNIVVVACCPLGSPGINSFYSSYGKSKTLPDLLGNGAVQEIGKKHGKTCAQVLLRFSIQRGVAVIPKSSNPKRIRENLHIFDFHLDEEDIDKLQRLEQGPGGKVGNWESWTWV